VRDHDRVVRLAGVRKRYRGRGEVLAGVDLEVAPGVPVSVVGGNGAGKSTLLRIAAGCASPGAGRVHGRSAVVGYLPQSAPPPARMTVLAYLRHHCAMHGTGATDLTAATSVLDDLDFTGDRAGPLAALSTGNLQKAGLAAALACAGSDEPAGPAELPLLVMDEPWTTLDTGAAVVLERALAGWAAARRPLLVADHTGRAARLPGALAYRLAGGTLTAQPDPRREPAADVHVVEADPPDPRRGALPARPAARRAAGAAAGGGVPGGARGAVRWRPGTAAHPVGGLRAGRLPGRGVDRAGRGRRRGPGAAQPVVERIGWSFCLAVVVVVVTAVQPWLPPVGTAVHALSSRGPPSPAADSPTARAPRVHPGS
jgi:ABC-type Mn2+/Zn2+ transport system ATPase subunit